MIIGLSLGVLVVPSYVAITQLGASVFTCWAIASTYVIALGIAFVLRYRQGKWTTMRVIESTPP
jgi:multidrug resistance protein, MATE family